MEGRNNSRRAKGEGSFLVKKDGSVLYRKTVGRLENGSRKVLSVTADSKAACIRMMREKEHRWKDIQEGKATVYDGVSVAELCELHLNYQIKNDELKPKSIDRRETTIKHISDYGLGKIYVTQLKGADVEEHIAFLQKNTELSGSSMIKVIDVLNAAYTWANRRGEIFFNPVLPVRDTLKKRIVNMSRKIEKDADVIVLSDTEERLFIEEASKHYSNGKAVYPQGIYGRLLLATGMRCGELLALRWSDVDFKNNLIAISKCRVTAKNRSKSVDRNYTQITGTTKNQKARTIRMTKEATDILSELYSRGHHVDDKDMIAITRNNTPYTTTNLEHGIGTIFRNCGLSEYKTSLHIFRRTFATNMYKNGAGIKEIAAYIGDLESTTEKYYISVRKKIRDGNESIHIVEVPENRKQTDGN